MKHLPYLICGLLMFAASAMAGSATLSWDCDTCAAEGALGFVLFYGPNDNADQAAPAIVNGIDDINNMAPSPYDFAVTINDPAARTLPVTLPKGRWYFRIVAYGPDQDDPAKFETSDFNAVQVSTKVRPSPPKNLR